MATLSCRSARRARRVDRARRRRARRATPESSGCPPRFPRSLRHHRRARAVRSPLSRAARRRWPIQLARTPAADPEGGAASSVAAPRRIHRVRPSRAAASPTVAPAPRHGAPRPPRPRSTERLTPVPARAITRSTSLASARSASGESGGARPLLHDGSSASGFASVALCLDHGTASPATLGRRICCSLLPGAARCRRWDLHDQSRLGKRSDHTSTPRSASHSTTCSGGSPFHSDRAASRRTGSGRRGARRGDARVEDGRAAMTRPGPRSRRRPLRPRSRRAPRGSPRAGSARRRPRTERVGHRGGRPGRRGR